MNDYAVKLNRYRSVGQCRAEMDGSLFRKHVCVYVCVWVFFFLSKTCTNAAAGDYYGCTSSGMDKMS